MRSRGLLIALTAVILFTACATQPPPSRRATHARISLPAIADSVSLAEFNRLPSAERRERRRRAAAAFEGTNLRYVRSGNGAPFSIEMEKVAHRWFSAVGMSRDAREVELALAELRRVVNAAPNHTRAWLEMGRIATALGDWELAGEALAVAKSALPVDPSARNDPKLGRRVRLAGAWLCYDRGFWEEGLAWLGKDATAWPHDLVQERQLVRGLLLAGAGRFQEAYLTAQRMSPYEITSTSPSSVGRIYRHRDSGYANNWVKAMAWHHLGETRLALHALGAMRPQPLPIPHMARYWRDVAMLSELDGDVMRARYEYALAMMGLAPLVYHVPFEGYTFPPTICGQPDVHIPYATFEWEYYLAGSLFSYACQMMAECSVAQDSTVRDSRGARAVEAFSACMRRRDRPLLAQALRGRTHFYMGDDEAALPDLREAHRALAADGRIDAVNSIVIGTVHMNAERDGEAIPFLEEAVDTAPDLAVAWRVLGVAYAAENRHDEADATMDQAVALDPYAVSGWYNRGLHHINCKRFAPALEDLLVAAKITPDDTQIRQLIANLELDTRDDGPDLLATAEARSDSIRADLVSGEWLARDATGGLGLDGGRRALDLIDIDFAARADSLAAVHAAAPTLQTRRELADACVQAGRSERALELLAPLWPDELSTPEKLLVLQVDRDLGDPSRAHKMAADLTNHPPWSPTWSSGRWSP